MEREKEGKKDEIREIRKREKTRERGRKCVMNL